MATVSLSTGPDRYSTVLQALELVEEDLAPALAGKERVVVKPNFVTAYRQLAATHVDAVRALLDVILRHHPGPVTIAEGASAGPTALAFRRYGFGSLPRRYPVRLVNLNRDATRSVTGFSRDLGPLNLPVSRTMLEADCLISVALLKTHDSVLATMALKNVAVGAVRGLFARQAIHQGPKAINLTLFKLLQAVRPHFSLLDGWEAMEGNGPSQGTPVSLGIALAGADGLAVDTLAAYLMGFDPGEIGYLVYCREGGLGEGDLAHIRVAGEPAERHRRIFRRHDDWETQINWQVESHRELLGLTRTPARG